MIRNRACLIINSDGVLSDGMYKVYKPGRFHDSVLQFDQTV